MAAALGRDPDIRPLEARNEVVHAFSDHSKMARVFEPNEPVPLRAGIRRKAEWVRAKGPREPVVFDDIEIEKNLPPSWL